jgi:hypothetical protein
MKGNNNNKNRNTQTDSKKTTKILNKCKIHHFCSSPVIVRRIKNNVGRRTLSKNLFYGAWEQMARKC